MTGVIVWRVVIMTMSIIVVTSMGFRTLFFGMPFGSLLAGGVASTPLIHAIATL